MPFIVGESVGPYQLVEQLGHGGMATVFKAFHSSLDRYVAIKALHPAFSKEPDFLTRFQREAQVIAKLEHPNIVPVYDYSEFEGRPYLVLKFVQGETLKAKLVEGSLNIGEITEIVNCVGAALEYAHRQGVLHRDVKPSNVLLAEDGHIYLADFGLARMAQAGESTISSDVMLGTPQYISPEQAMGQRNLDNGTDIYSFGVLLYQLVVGRVPFNADTPYSIIHDHIYSPLPIPRTLNESIPESIEMILLKALAKDRKDRYPDVESMISAWNNASLDSGEKQLASAELPQKQELLPVSVQEQYEPPIDLTSEMINAQSEGAAQEVEIPEKEEKSKPGRIWLAVAGVLLTCCLCLVGILAVRPGLRSQAGKIFPFLNGLLPMTTEEIPLITDQPLPASDDAILFAQKKVDAEPENPYAYLDLALAYTIKEMPEEAERAFRQALEYADEDYKFYAQAGNIFFHASRWLPAAQMYAFAIEYSPKDIPVEIIGRAYQSLYMAAEDKNAAYLFIEIPLERYNPAVVDVAHGRFSLFQGDLEKTIEVIRKLNEKGITIREIKLLEAEVLVAQGKIEEACDKLIGLVEDPVAPQWVRQVAENILNEIQK